MHLSEWLRSRGVTAAELAPIVGLKATTISRLLHGQSCTSRNLMAVHAATGGAVTPNDMLGVFPQQPETPSDFPNCHPIFTTMIAGCGDGTVSVNGLRHSLHYLETALASGQIDISNAGSIVIHVLKVPPLCDDDNANASNSVATAA